MQFDEVCHQNSVLCKNKYINYLKLKKLKKIIINYKRKTKKNSRKIACVLGHIISLENFQPLKYKITK